LKGKANCGLPYLKNQKSFMTRQPQNQKTTEKQEEEISVRIIIYPEDIMGLTKKSLRYCRGMLSHARVKLGLKKGTLVTYRQFSEAWGYNADEVRRCLKATLHIPLLLGIYLMLFKDDMGLGYRCLLAWVALIVFNKYLRRMIGDSRRSLSS
jgi:hypothetical protein